MFDPWAMLPPHITVHHAELDRLSAVTDGHSTVWLDERLTEVERRCALMHELVHLERGHVGHQNGQVELLVRAETARILVPFDSLWSVRHWAGTWHELAEELHVTIPVLADRMLLLTQAEREIRDMLRLEAIGEC